MRLAVFLPCYNQAIKDAKRAPKVEKGREWVFEELGKKSVWRGENSQHEIHLGISNFFFFYKMQLSCEIQT